MVEPAAIEPGGNASPKTILVCDDEPALRELVRAVLGGGYRFIEVDDGHQALELARELRPDLLVLDLMLPGLTGLDVLAAIRSDEELRSLRVIVVSAWTHAAERALDVGADRFMTKPFEPDDLSAAVEELLA